MTLRRAPVRTRYLINGTELEHVSQIKDLGVTLDSKLTFASHVSDIVRKGNRALGLLIRSFQVGRRGSKFNKASLLTAYFANVRSILEYCSVIWTGAAKTHTVRVDRVQHKFLIWLLTHTHSGYSASLSYDQLLLHFQISSLASRRVQHDILFLRNAMLGKLDVQTLLSSFSLYVPARSTRTRSLFNVPRARVCVVQNCLFNRLPREVNVFLDQCRDADIFNDSLGIFKSHVMKYVLTL